MVIGYAYENTVARGPSIAQQRERLIQAGCSRLFEDRETYATKSVLSYLRPGLTAALAELTPAVQFVVCRLDRLGNSLQAVYRVIALIDPSGAHLRSLDEDIDTSKMERKRIFDIFTALSQFENLRKR